jgi:hypothetical protein
MEIIKLVLSIFFALSLFLLLLSIVMLRLSLDRRVRKKLSASKIYDSYTDWYFGLGRSICFGVASIFEYPKKSSIMVNFYDSFDVKGFSNTFEKSLAWTMIVSLCVLLGTTICSQIISWFSF